MLDLKKSRVVLTWAMWTTLYIVVAGMIIPAKFGGEAWTMLVAIAGGFLMMAFAGTGFVLRHFKGEGWAVGLGVGLHQTVLVWSASIAFMPDFVGGGGFAVATAIVCLIGSYALLLRTGEGYPLVYHALTIAGLVGAVGGLTIGWPIAAFMAFCAVSVGAIVAWGTAKKLAPVPARW